MAADLTFVAARAAKVADLPSRHRDPLPLAEHKHGCAPCLRTRSAMPASDLRCLVLTQHRVLPSARRCPVLISRMVLPGLALNTHQFQFQGSCSHVS
eukprot:1022293-Rhodomonas_salina.1